jgi:HEAT repeat protein
LRSGLETTLELLAKTDNEAAVRVLIPALDSANAVIQEQALTALLRRRDSAGGREILDRMPRMKPQWQAIIRQYRGRMARTLRDALLGTDLTLCENACRAIILFRDYDLVPTLLSALEDRKRPNAELAARTVAELVELLYDELAGTRDPSDRRDPQLIRRYVVSSLELSVGRFGHHQRREVVECFLLLVNRDNVILKQILQTPHHVAHAMLMESLASSPQRGVIRLLLNFLDDPHAPPAALAVLAQRSDDRFLHYLLKRIGREPSPTVAQNLKRLQSVVWIGDTGRLLGQIDDAGQHAIVRLAMTAGIPRQQAMAVIEQVLLQGKPGGRREAARALAAFHGADANALAMRALADPDPQVQANLALQLRGRGIPGVLTILLQMIESPHDVVRRAAREGLTEFSFKRYLAAFDLLEDDVRRSTGLLVKKIDPQTLPLLEDEMGSPVRSRRLRSLVIARTIDVVEALHGAIIKLLEDEDHIVRLEAVTALAQSATPATRRALQAALGDTSEIVRQAAQRSLEESARRRPPAPRAPSVWTNPPVPSPSGRGLG